MRGPFTSVELLAKLGVKDEVDERELLDCEPFEERALEAASRGIAAAAGPPSAPAAGAVRE